MSTVAPGTVVERSFDPRRWDALAPDTVVQSSKWINAMLSRLPGDPLMTVYNGQKGLLGLVGAVVEDPSAYEAYNPWTILRAPQPVFPEVHRHGRPVAQLGSAAADMLPSAVLVAPGYLGDPVGPAGRDPGDVLAGLRGVCQWAWSAGLATVALLYTTPPASAVVEPAVAELGGESFDLTSRWVHEVTWSDPDGFHRAIGRRRHELRRQFRGLDRFGCTVGRADVEHHFDDAIEARCELLRWYDQPVDEHGEVRRLRTLVDTFGPDLRLWATWRDNLLVACALFLAYGRTLQNIWTGTTKLGRATPFAHLAATYHGPMRDVSNREFDRIDYGIGHGDTKRFQGCTPLPLRGHLIPRPRPRREEAGPQ
jgi:hypothetical protein